MRRRTSMAMIATALMGLAGAGCVTERSWSARETVPQDVAVPIVYNDAYNVHMYGFEKSTIWDTGRYGKIYDALVQSGVLSREETVVPRQVTDEELSLVHTKEWIASTHDPKVVARVFEKAVIAKLPSKMVEGRIAAPFRYQTHGTMLAAQLALEHGIACTLGGGFAHARSDGGEGFNLFADAPLAIESLRQSGWKGKVLVIDVDVHHGQGTAGIYRHDPSVCIMDVYNRGNYPRHFEKVDVAVELDPGTGDEEYLARFRDALTKVLDRFAPDLVIYVAGVDCCENDRIGGLAVTEQGLFERDKLVIDECTRRAIPLCITLAGGYWRESWRPSVRMIEYAAQMRKAASADR